MSITHSQTRRMTGAWLRPLCVTVLCIIKQPLTSENMGSFLAKSTTRVMAGVMILVNSLKASRSTLSPSDVGATGDWPIFSGYMGKETKAAD